MLAETWRDGLAVNEKWHEMICDAGTNQAVCQSLLTFTEVSFTAVGAAGGVLVCLHICREKKACFTYSSFLASFNFVSLSLKASLGSLLCVIFPSVALSCHYRVGSFHCTAKIMFEAGSLVRRQLFFRFSVGNQFLSFAFSYGGCCCAWDLPNCGCVYWKQSIISTRLGGKKQTDWMFVTKELGWLVFKADQCSQIGLISAFFFIQNITLLIMARFLFTNRN